MAEWKEYRLEDIIDKFIDYRGKTPMKTTFGIPLVTAKIVKNGRLLEPNEFIAEKDYEAWMTRGYPEINDVVLTTEAPLGEVALIKNKNIALAQRVITLQTNREICNSIFLKYYLESSEGQGALQARASGSTVEGIKAAELKKMAIFLPPLAEQEYIASIFASLDDKSDLLHCQNKTLEQLAETLFRQWFVEEAEENWEIAKVSDVAYINHKNVGKNFPFSEIEYLDTGSITKGLISEYQTYNLNAAPSRAQRLVSNNDIVYSLVRPIQRHYGLLYDVKPNTVASTGFCIITSKDFSSHFLYLLLTRDETVEYFDMIAEGSTSTYPSLKPSDIGDLEFLLPPKEKLGLFSTVVSDTWTKINVNQTQIITLTRLRNELLPKLMSSEIKIKI